MADPFSSGRNIFGLDDDFITRPAGSDYTTEASVKSLEDPRFHRDLRDYYEARGISGTTEELIDRWRSDNRWREANIGSTAFALGRSALASEQQNEREARLAAVWNAQPMFWEEGGAGWINALSDYVPAAILDPTNLFTIGKAGAVGLRAASIAGAKGQSALLAGVSKGALEGAKWEGAFNAAVGGAQSFLEQNREVNLGMSDGVSGTRLAADAAIGGVIGGAFGGVMGGVAGGVASRNAGRTIEELGRLGYTPGEVGAMRPEQFDRVLATQEENPVAAQARADAAAAAQAAELDRQRAFAAEQERARSEMGPPNMSAEDIIARTRSELEQDYLEARQNLMAETDPAARDRKAAIAEDYQTQLINLDQLSRAPARITALSERINKLTTTVAEDPVKAATLRTNAEQLTRALIDLQVDYRTLSRGTALEDIPSFLNRLSTFEETLQPSPAAARATGNLAPDPNAQAAAPETQAAQPAAPQPAAQAAQPQPQPQAQTPAAQPASPGAQAVTPATQRPAQTAQPQTAQPQAAATQAASPQAAAPPPAPPPTQQVAQFLRQAGPETTVAKIKAATGLDNTALTQAIRAQGPAVTRKGNKVIINNADALPQPEPTPAATQQPAPPAAQPAASPAAPQPDPAFARVREWANTQAEVTPERVTASIPDVTPAQAKLYLDQLVAEGAFSAPTSTGIYASRTTVAETPEPVRVSKPVARRAAELGIPIDALPPNAKVQDVDRVAAEAPDSVREQFKADQAALDDVLTEYSKLIPPTIVEEMKLFDDVDFMRALLKAEPRTAGRFDSIWSLYEASRAGAELEMRIGRAGMRLSPEDAEILMNRRIEDLVKLQLERDPDAEEATVREVITRAYNNRAAGEAGDPDRPQRSLAEQTVAEARRRMRAGGPGTDSTTAGRDPTTGRIQSIIKWGRDLSEDAGSIVQAAGRDESRNLSRARMPTYIQAPSRGQFAYEEAYLQTQASVEKAARHNAQLDKRIQNLARAAAEAAAKKATDADRTAAGARREANVQALRQQIKDLKTSGRPNINKELEVLERRVADEINAPDPIYTRVYNEVLANPRPALENWAKNQAKADVATIKARYDLADRLSTDEGRAAELKDRLDKLAPLDRARRAEAEAATRKAFAEDVASFSKMDRSKMATDMKRLQAEKEAYYLRQIEPQEAVDVAAFIATGGEERFAGGKSRPSKGQVAYIDALNFGKIYPDLYSLYLARGMSPDLARAAADRSVGLQPSVVADPQLAPTRASDPYQPIRDAIRKFKADANLAKFRAVLEKYADPGMLKPAPARQTQYPGLKDGQVVALLPRTGNERVRVMGFAAAKTGAAEDLVPPGKSIDDYEVIYLPPKQTAADRQAAIEEARAKMRAKATERGEAGDVLGEADAIDPATIVPRPQTMDIGAFSETSIRIPDAERPALVETLMEMSGLSRVDAEAKVNSITGEEILELHDAIEMAGVTVRDPRGNIVPPKMGSKRGWPATLDAYERRFAAIKALNNSIATIAPAGVARNAITRAEATRALRQALGNMPADRVKVVERVFFTFLSKDGGAPLIGRSNPENPGGGYSPATNTMRLPHAANFDQLLPGELVVLHELAHWSYFNVLTPADRIEFWGSLRKFYGQDGKLDTKRLNALTPPGVGNGSLNPQEMLANQFVLFAGGKVVPEATERGFWNRVTGYLQALFDWFVKKVPVDPAIVPTLSKMLPEQERIAMASADIAAPPPAVAKATPLEWETVTPVDPVPPTVPTTQTPAPSAAAAPEKYDPTKAVDVARKNLAMLKDFERDWELAIDSGNYDALITVAENTSSWLMASKNMFWVNRKAADDPLGKGFNWSKYYYNASKDIQAILNQKAGASPDFDPTRGDRAKASAIDGRVNDPKRKFEQLRQLYRTGHSIPADQALRAQSGEEAVYHGQFAKHKNVSNSALTWLFARANNDLNSFLARMDGRTPSAVPESVSPARSIDPQATEIAAKAVDAAVDRRMAEAATEVMDAAAKGKGRRRSAKPTITQIGGQSIEGMSIDELRALHKRVQGTEAAAAVEARLLLIARSSDPEVFRSRLKDVTPEQLTQYQRLSRAQLLAAYTKAMETGDTAGADLGAYEMARRRVTKAATTAKVQKATAAELEMQIGLPSHVGIPPSAPASTQEMLSRMTHRTPADEATTRALALRLALVGEGERPLTRGDVARIAGTDIDGANVLEPVSYDGEEFKTLRSQLRRLASALDEDGTTPAPQVVDEIATLAIRAVDTDRALAGEPNLAANIAEHFRHSLSRRALIDGLTDTRLISKVDEAIETARHLASGLVGRRDIRADYPGLVVGADISARDPSPIASRFSSDAVPATIAADYVDELRRIGGETYEKNVADFTGSGFGAGRVFYLQKDGSLLETPQPATAPRMGAVTSQLMGELVLQEEAAASALRVAITRGDSSTVAAAAERLAAIRQLVSEGQGPDTTVAPVYLKARAVARLDDTALYRSTDAIVGAIVRDLVSSGRVERLAGERLLASIPSEGVSGSQLWSMLTDVAGDGGAVNVLRSIGYDGFRTPDGSIRIFDPRATIAVDDNSLSNSRMPTHVDMRGALGEAMIASITTDGEPRSWAPVADELQMQIGKSNVVSRALGIMGAKKSTTSTEILEVRRANFATALMGSNVARLRETGRHYLADFAENHFAKFNEDLGKRLFDEKSGLLTRLHALDDANPVKRWARKVSPFFTLGRSAPTQPEAHFRIVAALRQPSGSMFEKVLKPEELSVYRDIRLAMQEEYRRLRSVGVPVNNYGPDYFPQVWSAEQIQNDSQQFLKAMQDYYRIESEYYGREFDEQKAKTFAENMFLTMSDQGVDGHLVEKSGHSFSPSADHIDHSRLINTQLPGVAKLLEPFLETDLESLIVKYFDASTRRRLFTEQFGHNSHGFRDYQAIAIDGREPIIKMLTTNKVLRRTTRRFNPESGAVVDDERATLEYVAPFADRPDLAADFVERIVAMRDPVAAKQELLDLMRQRDGSVPRAWEYRASAIAGALADFEGNPARLHADEHTYEENLMRVMMRKPLSSNQFAVDASRFIRNFNSVTLLGFTMLSSFGDVVLPLVRSGEFRATYKAWSRFASDPSYRRLMEGTGVAMESILNERLTHLYGAGTGRFTNAFFYLNGLTPWTNVMRKASAAVGHQTFIAMQDKATRYFRPDLPVEKQHPQFKVAYRFLKSYGLEEFATNRKSLEVDDILRDDQRVRMAINKFADEAVFAPNPQDIPLWAQTPVGAIVAQLKTFPLMMGRLARRVMIDDVMAAVRGAQEDGVQGLVANAPKRALAFLAVAPAFGAASLAAADIARGRGGEDNNAHELRTRNLANFVGAAGNQANDDNDFWGWYLESFMMVGGLGLLGDLFHKTAQNIDNGSFGRERILSTFLGPSVGTANSAINVAAGAYDYAIGGKESNAPERTAMREVLMRLPIAGGLVSQREALIDNVIGEPNTQ